MPRATSERREFYEALLSTIKRVAGEKLKGVIVFGSTVYMGRGRDVDIIVVVEGEPDAGEGLRLGQAISRELARTLRGLVFDVHVMGVREFVENLVPGSFLSGLALGYEVLYDRAGLENRILEFLERLSRERYVLHNRYGSWDLGFHAALLLRIRRKRVEKAVGGS